MKKKKTESDTFLCTRTVFSCDVLCRQRSRPRCRRRRRRVHRPRGGRRHRMPRLVVPRSADRRRTNKIMDDSAFQVVELLVQICCHWIISTIFINLRTPPPPRPKGIFTLGDTRSLFWLIPKIPPLVPKVNFDADVKKPTARHQCENRCMMTCMNPSVTCGFWYCAHHLLMQSALFNLNNHHLRNTLIVHLLLQEGEEEERLSIKHVSFDRNRAHEQEVPACPSWGCLSVSYTRRKPLPHARTRHARVCVC